MRFAFQILLVFVLLTLAVLQIAVVAGQKDGTKAIGYAIFAAFTLSCGVWHIVPLFLKTAKIKITKGDEPEKPEAKLEQIQTILNDRNQNPHEQLAKIQEVLG